MIKEIKLKDKKAVEEIGKKFNFEAKSRMTKPLTGKDTEEILAYIDAQVKTEIASKQIKELFDSLLVIPYASLNNPETQKYIHFAWNQAIYLMTNELKMSAEDISAVVNAFDNKYFGEEVKKEEKIN